jgi:hypothetical protein
MAAYPDPPVEWVRGSRFGFAWIIGTISALAILMVLSMETSLVGGPSNFAGHYWSSAIVEWGLVFASIFVVSYSPLNLRIGLTPKGLIVRGLLWTHRYPWYQLYRYSSTEFRTDPPGVVFSERIRLNRRQGDRVTNFWIPAAR